MFSPQPDNGSYFHGERDTLPVLHWGSWSVPVHPSCVVVSGHINLVQKLEYNLKKKTFSKFKPILKT